MAKSAIKQGARSVNIGFTGGWYFVGAFDPTKNSTVSMNNLFSSVQADAEAAGLRARIHAWDIYVKSDEFLVAKDGDDDLYNVRYQRMAFLQMKITQPNLKGPYTDKNRSLTEWSLRGRAINPQAMSLVRLHPYVQQGYTADEAIPTLLGLNAYSRGDLQSLTRPNWTSDYVFRVDGTKGWETDANPILCENSTGSDITPGSWRDHNVIPATVFSGSGLAYDQIPLELTTNQNAPWTFNLSPNKIGGNNIASMFDGAPAGANPDSAELWVYLSFVPKSADWCFGVLYQHIDYPQQGNNMILDPHYYHSIGVYPDFEDTETTGDLDSPMPYDNFYQFATGGILRQFVNKVQTFPLVKESEYQRTVDGINIIANRLCGVPESLYSFLGSDTRRSGATALPGVPRGILGHTTEMPILWLAFNCLAAKGFANGFMAVPQSANEMRIQLENQQLSADQLARIKATYVSEKWDQDKDVLMTAAQYGAPNPSPTMPLGQFMPVTLGRSGKDSLVAPLTPNTCVNPNQGG